MEGAEDRGRDSGLLATGRGGTLGAIGLIGALLTACETPAIETPAPAPLTVERSEVERPVGDKNPTDPTADVCRAGELQWLVGKPKTEIPVPVDVVNRRVTCTTCAVTGDFSPYRVNIFYNQQTEIVEQIRCG